MRPNSFRVWAAPGCSSQDRHAFMSLCSRPRKRREQLNAKLLKQKVIGGLPLSRWYPELGNASLWCVTELNTREQIDHAASLLQHDSEEALTRA